MGVQLGVYRYFLQSTLKILEWGKVLVAGLMVFSVAELEKFVIRSAHLAARWRLSGGSILGMVHFQ
jgi:hypothetical protein